MLAACRIVNHTLELSTCLVAWKQKRGKEFQCRKGVKMERDAKDIICLHCIHLQYFFQLISLLQPCSLVAMNERCFSDASATTTAKTPSFFSLPFFFYSPTSEEAYAIKAGNDSDDTDLLWPKAKQSC